MNHSAPIYNILEATTTWPVGNRQMAQSQALPFVVFALDNIEAENTKQLHPGIDLVSFTVLLFSDDMDAAHTEANKLRTALVAEYESPITNCWHVFASTDYLPEINSYVITQSYTARMAYTPYTPPPTGDGIGSMIIGLTFIIS
jgi:hypothetical protein